MADKKSIPTKKDVSEDKEPKDVLEEILKDHKEARAQFRKTDKSKAIGDLEELYAMLYGHHRAEEKHVFPDVKKVDEEAKELVAHLLEEHEEVESGLKAMIDAKKMDHDKFMKIKSEVYEHMRDEENDLFEKAVEGLTQAQLKAKLEPFEKTEESEKEKAL